MASQAEKGLVFRALHKRPSTFVIPNPWDIGTARLLEFSGFEALATTSAGYAFSQGLPDGSIGRDQMMEHIRTIAQASDLPVSADLENGYGDDPSSVAESIRLAAQAGAVGASIEDFTGRPDQPIYEFDFAVERVRAAVAAARALPFDFVLTARAENFLHRRISLSDTIARLQAFEQAGADVLYAPGLPDQEAIKAVLAAVRRPVNVVMGLAGLRLTLNELEALGVRRISVGSALSRAALGEFLRASQEIREQGTFTFADRAIAFRDLNQKLER